MICSLKGTLIMKRAGVASVEVGGIGFLVSMSSRSISSLPATGEEVFIWTIMSVRDDGMSLYGFLSEDERDLFERLVTVSGVGPKAALAALSTFPPDELARVIALGDTARVATIPGIGKKTAQRIVLELKGSLDELMGVQNLFSADEAQDGVATEAIDALLAMGFTSAEATLALKGYDGDMSDTAAIIRYGLKKLGSSR